MLDAIDFTPKKAHRRKRDPDGTRAAILEAAGKLLARDGPEGLSVSQVAQLAGVNRGTAYQHFPTREQLAQATAVWVGERLRLAVFGGQMADPAAALGDPKMVAEQMTAFAMENPELGRVWLFEVLSSSRPDNDPFWHQYWTQFEKFAQSDMAQPGIDAEVHSVLVLLGTFLWPVFARAQTRSAKDRQQLARRFSSEILRWSLYGTMRPEKYPELDARVKKAAAAGRRSRRGK